MQERTKLEKIRDLHRFTEVGLAECKRILEETSGDFFGALCVLLTPEDFKEKAAAFRVREQGGSSIADTVTWEESQLMERLRRFFEMQAIGPHRLIFASHHLPALILGEPHWFDRLVSASGSSWLSHTWAQVGEQLPVDDQASAEGLSVQFTHARRRTVALISLPTRKSSLGLNLIFISRQKRRLRLLRGPYATRYFLVSEPIPTPRQNLVVSEELVAKGNGLTFGRRFEAQNISLTLDGLDRMLAGA